MSTANHKRKHNHQDRLRAEFTAWLNTTLIRARSDYLDQLERQPSVVSLDAMHPDFIADPQDCFESVERSQVDFEFEEARLAKAFEELPLMRKEVLRLLFVEMKEPEEISAILHCSTNYVYLQKSRALKRLRELLTEYGDDRSD